MEEIKVGVCTSCGMAVPLPHECTPDHQFLGTTDWMRHRHHDQIELGIPTTLTPEEFTKLQQDRQAARDRIAREA